MRRTGTTERDVSAPADILFVHGGGDEAHAYDAKIVDRLQREPGAGNPIRFPLIEGLEALDWAAVESELGGLLQALAPGAIVIGHSVGGASTLKLLSGGLDPHIAHLFLLAPPCNGADGEWGDDDFAFPADFAERLPTDLRITLWHSADDEVIGVDSAHRYAEKLPRAKVVLLDGYGHQFTGSLQFLAEAIHGAVK
jgi:pimeloyl-ACP methyl ester carboxylesterase